VTYQPAPGKMKGRKWHLRQKRWEKSAKCGKKNDLILYHEEALQAELPGLLRKERDGWAGGVRSKGCKEKIPKAKIVDLCEGDETIA